MVHVTGLSTFVRSIPASAWVLIALAIAVAFVVPRFLTFGNLLNVARVAAILALAAYGQAIVIIAGGLDFSSGSAVALTSVVTVLGLTSIGLGTGGALLLGAGAAIAISLVNGILIAWFEIPAFLVTLGSLIGIHGFASLLVGGIPLEAPSWAGFGWIGQGDILGIPAPIVLAAVGFAILTILLTRSSLGRAWYLIGARPRAADLAGIHRRRSLFLAYAVNGVFVALAGLVLTARVSSGQPNLFPTLPFEAIAACATGGLALTGGTGRPIQVLIGVLILAIAENAVVLLNFTSSAQLMLIGTLTVVALLLQQIRWRHTRRIFALASLGRPTNGNN